MLARLLAGVVDTAYLSRRFKAALASSVAYVVAGVLALMAAISALVAAYAGLREAMIPAWGAALIISACFALLALAAFLVARRRRPMPPPHAAEGDPAGVAAAAMAALAPLIDDAVRTARERPGEAALTALLAGIIAGTFRRR